MGWTTQEVQPKGQGADYRDIDNDKWDAAWNQLYADAEDEKSKPKPEAAKDPNSQMGWKTWVPLMDALRNKTEADIEVEKMKSKTRDYIRMFIHPKYRRHVKWVQTTVDTEEIFLSHTIVENVHE